MTTDPDDMPRRGWATHLALAAEITRLQQSTAALRRRLRGVNQLTLHGGQTIYNVHGPDNCAGEVCCIHNPSPHHMRNWHQRFDGNEQMMYRVCPHNVYHVDPDSMWTLECECEEEYPCCIPPHKLVIVEINP